MGRSLYRFVSVRFLSSRAPYRRQSSREFATGPDRYSGPEHGSSERYSAPNPPISARYAGRTVFEIGFSALSVGVVIGPILLAVECQQSRSTQCGNAGPRLAVRQAAPWGRLNMIDVQKYRIVPGAAIDLRETSAREDGGISKKKGKKALKKLSKRLAELQELLYARQERGLLVIFQAMDAGGKDSTTRRVFRKLDPAGVRVKSFSQPTPRERSHDFLWRIHAHTPRRGYLAIFNRSHYEDVVAVRVRELQPPDVWQGRFEHINAFERLLASEHTIILKFFLHVSKQYQKERLERRLTRPDKRWKFHPKDLDDRERWDEFINAYSEAICRCTTAAAPWHVVPAERRWFRDLVVMQTVVDKLQSLEMSYPEPDFDPAAVEIR